MKAIVKTIAVADCLISISSLFVIASTTRLPISRDLPVNKFGLNVCEFIKLSAKKFSMITGKNLNLKARIPFSLRQKMKRQRGIDMIN